MSDIPCTKRLGTPRIAEEYTCIIPLRKRNPWSYLPKSELKGLFYMSGTITSAQPNAVKASHLLSLWQYLPASIGVWVQWGVELQGT